MSTRADPGDAGWLNDPGDEEDVPEDETWETFAMTGVKPEQLPDPTDRAKYAKFLETYKPET